MNLTQKLLASILVPVVFLLPTVAQHRTRATFIRGATVIDGTGKSPQVNVNILIDGGRIQAIGPDVKAPDGAESIDAVGKFVIPGLLDARVQIGPTPGNGVFRGEISIEQRLQSLRALLAAGVTTVRLVQGDLDEQLLYQRWQKEALLVGPKVIIGGPTFTAPGGIPTREYSVASQSVKRRETREVRNEDDARDMARELAHSGGQVFEIVYDAGPEGDPSPGLGEPAIQIVTQEAHGHDLKVFCEVGRDKEAVAAESMAVDSIEGVWEEALSAEALVGMKSKSIFFIPALTEQGDLLNLLDEESLQEYLKDPIVQQSLSNTMKESLAHEGGLLGTVRKGIQDNAAVRSLLEQQRARAYENVKRAQAAGVELAVGTGSGTMLVFPGAAVHRELQLLVKAGLSPMEAIQSATRNTAQSLGVGNVVGTLESGKQADLIVLRADPLADIRNTEKIEVVMQEGRVVKREDLVVR